MMKKILTLLLIVLTINSYSQTYQDSKFGIFGAYADEYNWFQSQMGFTNTDYWNWVDSHFQNLGTHWTRSNTQLIWDLIDPNLDGVYNWNIITNPDSVITNVYDSPADVNWLGCIHVMDDNSRNPLNYPTKWQNFLQAVIERYNGDGTNDLNGFVNVKYWQIGNEIQGLSDSLSSVEYAQIVALSESAIHSVDSTAKICLVAPTQAFLPDTFLANTIIELSNMGVPFDVIDIHHWGNSFNYKMTALPSYRTFLDNNGYSNVEIWSCEHGTHCYQPSSVPYQSENEQASSLLKRYVWNFNNGLDKLFWNNLMEWHGFAGDTNNIFNSMGLIGDGSYCGEPVTEFNYLRKSYYSYKKLAENIDADKANFTVTNSFHNESAGNYGYTYNEISTGDNFEIFWTDNDSATYTFTITANYQLTELVPVDTLGTFTTQFFTAGTYNLTIYKNQVYLLKINTGTNITNNTNNTSVNIYPNPLYNRAIIEFENPGQENYTMTLYNIQGKLVRTISNIMTGQIIIEKGKLTSGQYFFQLRTNRQVCATGKLTIE